MNVLSKPIKEPPKELLCWKEYYKKNVKLRSYKIPQLKSIARSNYLHVSGTKSILIQRIEFHFRLMKYATCIQSYFRRHLVRHFFKLRGEHGKDEIYVNDTDFYTMEPLTEMPFYDFFNFKDASGFLYGFNVDSFVMLCKTNNFLTNPYTREKMDVSIIGRITSLCRIIHILFKKHNIVHQNNIIQEFESTYTMSRRHAVVRNLEEIRHRSLHTRIEQVFLEIDMLGNYTQSSWLLSLNPLECSQFLQFLVDIWNYRSDMSILVRRQITPYYNPFYFRINETPPYHDISYHHRVVTVIENIVFSGGDIEYRKLGIMHILTALTIVSSEAREAVPWLYESVIL